MPAQRGSSGSRALLTKFIYRFQIALDTLRRVVLPLMANILNYHSEVGLPKCNNAVLGLPAKVVRQGQFVIDKVRTVTLDLTDEVRTEVLAGIETAR